MEEQKSLDRIPPEQYAEIVAIDAEESVKRRLMELGLVRGTVLKPVLVSPGGDPIAYEVRGTVLALRKQLSSHIAVREVEKI